MTPAEKEVLGNALYEMFIERCWASGSNAVELTEDVLELVQAAPPVPDPHAELRYDPSFVAMLEQVRPSEEDWRNVLLARHAWLHGFRRTGK